jgi:hypothetical protein
MNEQFPENGDGADASAKIIRAETGSDENVPP